MHGPDPYDADGRSTALATRHEGRKEVPGVWIRTSRVQACCYNPAGVPCSRDVGCHVEKFPLPPIPRRPPSFDRSLHFPN
eukprot:4529125-Prorocentrum_lima.AAC.1